MSLTSSSTRIVTPARSPPCANALPQPNTSVAARIVDEWSPHERTPGASTHRTTRPQRPRRTSAHLLPGARFRRSRAQRFGQSGDSPRRLDAVRTLLYKQLLMARSRILLGAAAGAVALGAAALVLHRAGLLGDRGEEQWTLVETYCVECHNSAEAAGGLVLEGMGPDSVPLEPEVFEAAVRKLRGRLMPPPGGPQPEQPRVDSFVAWLERTIDRNAELPRAGHVPIQRLNRTEYAAAVHDLVGVDIDAAEFLPAEIEVDGFDNIAAALSVSPAFLEQYIGVARHVAHVAVGETVPKVTSVSFPRADGRSGRLRRRHAARHARRRALHAQFPGRRRIPRHDHGSRRRARTRARSKASTRSSCCSTATRCSARSSAAARISVREPRRRTGARRDHAAVREDSRAGHGRRARDRDHVHRARARRDRRPHLRLPAVRRLQLHGQDARAAPHRQRRSRRAVRRDGFVAHGEPRQDLRLHARVGGRRAAPAPSASRSRSRRARSAAPPSADDLARLLPFYENGRASRHLRHGRRAALDGRAREPGLPVSRDRAGRPATPPRPSRSTISSSLRASRSSSGARAPTTSCSSSRPRASSATRTSSKPSRAHARGSARAYARHGVRAALAQRRRARGRRARRAAVPRVHRRAARRLRAGDRALHRERPAREPQRARAADGRPHVRQRAARAPLRHGRRSTARSSAA